MSKELAQSLNMNEKELADYVSTIGRVLCENFMKDVWNNKITLQEAFRKSVELWDKKHTDMCTQLLNSPMEGNGVTRKCNQMADILCTPIYEAFNK